MTKFEFYSLIISIFTAIGTCGATALALFFWLNDKTIKLGFRAMHADTYGSLQNVDGGFFVVSVTNRSNWPITLEMVGLKCYQKKYVCKKVAGFCLFENTSHDNLPKKLEFGQTYIYSIPMNDAIRRLQSFEETEKIKICDIRIIVCASTAKKEIVLNPEKYLKSLLLNTKKIVGV